MSKWMYIAQALLIAGVLYTLFRRQPLVLRLQIVGWVIGVIGIWWRFGEGQLSFYSNDQVHYASIVRILVHETWPRTLGGWLEFSKIPYPAAAVPLALIGINQTLALKSVSLVFLLALSRELLGRDQTSSIIGHARVLYLTGCGLIGSFFSVLALRETMMMYFVYRFATDKSLGGRVTSLTILFLLRSHLAAALIAAELTLALWKWVMGKRKLNYAEAPALILLGATIGTLLFTWRFIGVSRIRTPFNGDWGISETLQVASNFAGLQFLTAHEAFIRLSVTDLLMLRVVFSDTILIPLAFTIACLVLRPLSRDRHRFALLAFTTYVSIVRHTDFNSFRQNIPLMPLMGLVALEVFQERREHRERREVAREPAAAASSAYGT